MTGRELKAVLSDDPMPAFSNTNITDIGTITADNYQAEKAAFINCHFQGPVTFDNVNFRNGINFHNCVFDSDITFSNCRSEELHGRIGGIILRECHVFGLDVSRCALTGIHITGDHGRISKFGHVNFMELQSVRNRIAIEYAELGDLDIRYTSCEDLRINKSIINGKTRIESVIANSIGLTQVDLIQDFHLRGGEIRNSIVFNDGKVSEDVFIDSALEGAVVTIAGTKFARSMMLSNSSPQQGFCRELYLSATRFARTFVLNGGLKSVERIKVQCSTDMTGSIEIIQCRIKKSTLTGLNDNSNIVFRESQFNILTLETFSNRSGAAFIGCRGVGQESRLEILNSDLGQAKFFNFSFRSFHSIVVSNSLLSEIGFTLIDWFEDSVLHTNAGGTFQPSEKREVYRQLKLASERMGDRLQSLNFQASELRVFEQSIIQTHSFLSNDRLTLLLSRTNSFGLNWQKPLLLAVAFTLIFYILLTITVSEKLCWGISLDPAEWKATWQELVGHTNILAQMFNPARNVHHIVPSGSPDFAYWLDGVHRIVLAFFIVQIVGAFRKYVKH